MLFWQEACIEAADFPEITVSEDVVNTTSVQCTIFVCHDGRKVVIYSTSPSIETLGLFH